MAAKTECYLDTSACIAFLDKSDSNNALYRRLFLKPPRLIASALVVAEGHAWFLRRYDAARAIQFLAFVRSLPALDLIPFDTAAIDASSTVIKQYPDQPLTMTDAHGIAIIKRRRIRTCWSTDRHLALSGALLAGWTQ